jgi:hypothetical protein
VPSLERSYGPEQVKDALGFAPAAPVNFGQVIPGFGGLVSYFSALNDILQIQTYVPG